MNINICNKMIGTKNIECLRNNQKYPFVNVTHYSRFITKSFAFFYKFRPRSRVIICYIKKFFLQFCKFIHGFR